MAIPGYDASNVAEYALESAGARVALVAGVVPDEFGLEKSVSEPPAESLADPIDLVDSEDLKAVEAVRIALVYDPSRLPPGASPTDVAVAVETEDGWDRLLSTVDLEETTVTAVLNDRPPGSTVVAAFDGSDETTEGTDRSDGTE
ncbi:hypothetical protein [Natrinema halophilum]|uniref:Uncharacterized protein n=1 Tax=Natrinema halophilum TaxID=1699371 RepID=A0A7D5H3T2_9EURY|nr:hypothetical protein [Natrinema halophilum]QLG50051.1 hypothetical protein HYG82_14895 [Natrinema halophilum]